MMNELQARTLREAHDGYVRQISRKSRRDLVVLYQAELSADSKSVIFGGPCSKDELVSALVNLRYPLAKLNESIHVLYHSPEFPNEVCEFCNPDPCGVCGSLSSCEYVAGGSTVVNGRHVSK